MASENDLTTAEGTTDTTDWKALFEAEKSAHDATRQQSRKWEERAKANKDGATKATTLEEQVAALTEQVGAITKERDELAARQARADMVAKVAADTGLDADVVAALCGADIESLTAAANVVKAKTSTSSYPATRDRGPVASGKAADDGGLRAAAKVIFKP